MDNCVLVEQHGYQRNVVSERLHYKAPTKLVGQVQNVYNHHLIEMSFFLPRYSSAIDHAVISNIHSLAQLDAHLFNFDNKISSPGNGVVYNMHCLSENKS